MKKRNTLHKTICIILVVLIIISLTITACGPKLTLDQQLIQELMKDCTDNGTGSSIEEEILYKFLSTFTGGKGYVVVNTLTIPGIVPRDNEDVESFLKRVEDIETRINYNTPEYDIHSLMIKFLNKNSQRYTLTIKSCVNEGYYIDQIKYLKHQLEIKKDFSYKDFPSFKADVEVSMPVYDAETGYVLIFSHSIGSLLSISTMHLMKYEEGTLSQISYCTLLTGQAIRW